MNNLFEFCLPDWMRKRRVMDAEEVTRHLAEISETNPAYVALLNELHEQFAEEVTGLLSNTLGQSNAQGSVEGAVNIAVSQANAGAVEYQRGRAASLYALILRIENQRLAAREEAAEKARRESRKQGL